MLGFGLTCAYAAEENRFFEADFTKLVSAIERALARLNPRQVLIPLPSFNQDHQRAYRAAITALRPTELPGPEVYCYEYPPQFWGVGAVQGEFTGRTYLPLTEEGIAKKIAALKCHESMLYGREDSLLGVAGTLALARMRGLECGHSWAEMYVPLRTFIDN
jgi:LmbE family N-acetylglucosaminyl deacetylase